jgi:predicted Na+-dependent transporter
MIVGDLRTWIEVPLVLGGFAVVIAGFIGAAAARREPSWPHVGRVGLLTWLVVPVAVAVAAVFETSHPTVIVLGLLSNSIGWAMGILIGGSIGIASARTPVQ